MSEPVSDSMAALLEAERLMHGGSFESAVEILQKVVDRGPSVQAICMLASSYLELGEHDRALRYASVAVEREPSFVPARDVRARVSLALQDYASVLSDYGAVSALSREQRPIPPDKYSIPAHVALHNIEQLDYILAAGNYDAQAFAGVFTEELPTLAAVSQRSSMGQTGKRLWCPCRGETAGLSPTRRTFGLRKRSCHDT